MVKKFNMRGAELLLSLLSVVLGDQHELRRVKAGCEYEMLHEKEAKGKKLFGEEVGVDKVRDCSPGGLGEEVRSLHQFTTEDIEKTYNVSLSDPEYAGKVLLVVNLASF